MPDETDRRSSSKENKTTFACIYARTSSPNQKNNFSIGQQIERCWQYCENRGWVVKYVFVDEAESAKTIDRPKFQLMMEKAESRSFDVIVFWKLDRFCRSLADLVNVERALRGYGVQLCSVTEFIDTTTSVGRFNYRSLASVAELERELIGERARLGMYALARELRWPNPHPPLGYIRDVAGRLIVKEEEAVLVRNIFKRYKDLKSLPQLAYELNAAGLKTKKGEDWSPRALRDVLTNPIYIGEYRVAGVVGRAEELRIVEDEVFKTAQETMRRYRCSKAGATSRPPMPLERKRVKLDALLSRYTKFLEEVQFLGRGG